MSALNESRATNAVRKITSMIGFWLKQQKIRLLLWCIDRNAAVQRWLVNQLQGEVPTTYRSTQERRSLVRHERSLERHHFRIPRRINRLEIGEPDDEENA